jgi:type I restriction enzyme S subunit
MKFAVKSYQIKKNIDPNPTVLSLTKQGVKIKTDLAFGKSTENYVGHQIVEPKQFVFTPRDFDATPILCGIARDAGCISNLYLVFDVADEIHPQFLEYYFWGLKFGYKFFEKLSFGMRHSFNRSQFEQIPLLHPDLRTQKQIAAFLDRETSRIDQLIEKKSILKKCLQKKAEAEIRTAVLGGEISHFEHPKNSCTRISTINPSAKGFALTPLSRISKIVSRGSGQASDVSDQGVVRYVTPEDLSFVRSSPTRLTTKSPDGQAGDLAVCLIASVGKCSVVDKPFRANPQIAVIRATTCDNVWLSYALRAAKSDIVANANMSGVMPFINGSEFMRTVLPVPSIEKQKKIANHLDRMTEITRQAIEKTENSISLLREYRSSLITAAVTGQIDVTTFKANTADHDPVDREVERAIA